MTHSWIEIEKHMMSSKTIKLKGQRLKYYDDLTKLRFCTPVGLV